MTILTETQTIYLNPCIKWGHNNETAQWKHIKEVVWFDLISSERKVYVPILWIPNSFASSPMVDEVDYKTSPFYYVTSNDGTILTDILKTYKIHCPIQYEKFPFDRSICVLKIESAVVIEKTVITGLEQQWADDVLELEMWTIRRLETVNLNKTYKTSPEGIFSRVNFYFEIERKGTLFVHTLILPSVMLLILQLGFIFLPSKGEGRAVYSMTVMLASSVLMTSVLSEIPRTSQHIAFIFNLSVQTIIGTLCTMYSLISISVRKVNVLRRKTLIWQTEISILKLVDVSFFCAVSFVAFVVNCVTYSKILS